MFQNIFIEYFFFFIYFYEYDAVIFQILHAYDLYEQLTNYMNYSFNKKRFYFTFLFYF